MPFYLGFLLVLSIIFSGAIFGFFFAWICSTMWGLDAIDPRTSITAMQAMNASVRNIVFAPAFFATPVILLITSFALHAHNHINSAMIMGSAAIFYFFFGLLLTMVINVPMNEALAVLEVPQELEQAQKIWMEYSPRWQFWNQARTIASGISLTLVVVAILKLKSPILIS